MARSIKKGPYIAASLMRNISKARSLGKKKAIKTWSRSSMVTPELVGMNFEVHNGRKFINVFITENMVGHRLGEFAQTRTMRLHSGQRKAGAQKK